MIVEEAYYGRGESMEKVVVVGEMQQSTMASIWTEFLCLQELPGGGWRLDIRSYAVIGEASDYTDEYGELPDEVEGLEVVGTEDGLVVVNLLVQHSEDYPVYEFSYFDPQEFKKSFGDGHSEWYRADVIESIRKTINSGTPN